MINDKRSQQLQHWLKQIDGWQSYHISVASADASFRRYFRIQQAEKSAIVMDAPPEQEDSAPFIDTTRRLSKSGVNVPKIFAHDLKQGFMLLEDFGNTLYLDRLTSDNVDQYYTQAMTELLSIQKSNTDGLTHYDQTMLLTEMALMPTWFLEQHLSIALSPQQQKSLQDLFSSIANNIKQQPQCFVHRDYHSRNLMLTPTNQLGVIDHQGAVIGSIGYDLVSLVRDCYIAWPEQRVYGWIEQFRQQLIAQQRIPSSTNKQQFAKMVDITGLQRHIKVLGIFCRLYYRDQKPGYLDDLPRVLHYVTHIAKRHDETLPLVSLFDTLDIKQLIKQKVNS